MFTAFEVTEGVSNDDQQVIIDIANMKRTPENREQLKDKNRKFVCRLCNEPLETALGPIRVWHFRHARKDTCDWEAWSEPESPMHHALKRASFSAMENLFPGSTIRYEAILRSAHRIADLLVTLPDGDRIAVECQLSKITLEELQSRTLAYERYGMDVIWIFNRKTVDGLYGTTFKALHDWLYERGNYIILAEPETRQIDVPLGTHDGSPQD